MTIEFNDEQMQAQVERPELDQQPKGLAGSLIKMGVVKNKKQANILFIGLIIVLVVVMFFALTSL